MEPLNLMVSLSILAKDEREHKHGLSRPAGSGQRSARGWWSKLVGGRRRANAYQGAREALTSNKACG
ncbi:hypothetical protein [Kribbella sp. NPDC055071]